MWYDWALRKHLNPKRSSYKNNSIIHTLILPSNFDTPHAGKLFWYDMHYFWKTSVYFLSHYSFCLCLSYFSLEFSLIWLAYYWAPINSSIFSNCSKLRKFQASFYYLALPTIGSSNFLNSILSIAVCSITNSLSNI